MNIPLPNDELIPDEALAAEWGCTRRSLSRYESQTDGLPFVMIGGRKYRPLNACRAWLAKRVKQPNSSRTRPKRTRRPEAHATA